MNDNIPDNQANAQALHLYDQAMQQLAEAAQLDQQAMPADMSQLLPTVEAFSKAVEAMPEEQRGNFEEHFSRLFDALGQLAEGLKGKRDEIAAMLNTSQQHQKANSAYAKTFHIETPDKE